MIDVWHYHEYTLDSEYDSISNMLGLHMVLIKIYIIINYNRYTLVQTNANNNKTEIEIIES